MNIAENDYIQFVPNKMVSNPTDYNGLIFVFGKKKNGKIYKRKRIELGCILFHTKPKEWHFVMAQDVCLCCETMLIIALFLHKLNVGAIKYDEDKGELYESDTNEH